MPVELVPTAALPKLTSGYVGTLILRADTKRDRFWVSDTDAVYELKVSRNRTSVMVGGVAPPPNGKLEWSERHHQLQSSPMVANQGMLVRLSDQQTYAPWSNRSISRSDFVDHYSMRFCRTAWPGQAPLDDEACVSTRPILERLVKDADRLTYDEVLKWGPVSKPGVDVFSTTVSFEAWGVEDEQVFVQAKDILGTRFWAIRPDGSPTPIDDTTLQLSDPRVHTAEGTVDQIIEESSKETLHSAYVNGVHVVYVNERVAVLINEGTSWKFGPAIHVGKMNIVLHQDPTRGLVAREWLSKGTLAHDLFEFVPGPGGKVVKRKIFSVPTSLRSRISIPSIASTGELVVFQENSFSFLKDDGSVDATVLYSHMEEPPIYRNGWGDVRVNMNLAKIDNEHFIATPILRRSGQTGYIYKITRPSPEAQSRCKGGNGQVLSVGEAWQEVPDLPWESIQEVWGRGGFVFGTYLSGGGQLSFQVREPRETTKEGEKDYRVIESDTGEVLSITGAIAIRSVELPGTPSSEAKLYVKSVGSSHVLVCTDQPRSR